MASQIYETFITTNLPFFYGQLQGKITGLDTRNLRRNEQVRIRVYTNLPHEYSGRSYTSTNGEIRGIIVLIFGGEPYRNLGRHFCARKMPMWFFVLITVQLFKYRTWLGLHSSVKYAMLKPDICVNGVR